MNSQVNLSSMFSRPLLIYDDTCLSCGKFAEIVNIIIQRLDKNSWTSLFKRGLRGEAGNFSQRLRCNEDVLAN